MIFSTSQNSDSSLVYYRVQIAKITLSRSSFEGGTDFFLVETQDFSVSDSSIDGLGSFNMIEEQEMWKPAYDTLSASTKEKLETSKT